MVNKEKEMLQSRIKKGAGILFFTVFLLGLPFPVMGAKKAEPPKEFTIDLDKFEEGEDADAAFSPQITYDKEKDQLSLEFSTEGQKEDQYPVSFFENTKQKLEGYSGIVLSIVNEQAEDVKMNMLLSTQDDEVLVVRDGAKVVLKEGNTWQETETDLGCFTIPADFNGEVYLPFFALAQTKDKEDIDGIYGIGFTFVLPEDDTLHVTLEAIRVLPAADMQALIWFEVSGADTVLRPTVGESIAEYSVAFYNMEGTAVSDKEKVSYEIKKADGGSAEGAAFDKNGKLTVTKDAKDGEYQIFARCDSGQNFVRNVALKGSWTETQKTENGYDASMLATDQVTEIVSKDSPFMNASLILVLRVVAAAVVVVFLGYYVYKHRKYKKEFVETYYKGEK